jgi:membrane-associated protein
VELLTQLMDVVLHLDQHLQALVASHGSWIYLILFLIIFC